MEGPQEPTNVEQLIGPVPFAVGLFLTIVSVALVAEVPLATITDRSVAFDDALSNGVIVGSVFAVIYLVGAVLTTRVFGGDR